MDSFVFEYGDIGTHFYIVLEGKVEIQIPDKERKEEFEEVRELIKQKKELLLQLIDEMSSFEQYREKLIDVRKKTSEAMKVNTLLKIDRRFSSIIFEVFPSKLKQYCIKYR